jgi:hypothetical protein
VNSESQPVLERASSSASKVHTYRLKFFDNARGLAKDIEFDAHDAAQALIIAHQEARNSSAELWCDGRKVCTIRRIEAGAWKISAAGP